MHNLLLNGVLLVIRIFTQSTYLSFKLTKKNPSSPYVRFYLYKIWYSFLFLYTKIRLATYINSNKTFSKI